MKINEVLGEGLLGSIGKGVAKGFANAIAPGAIDSIASRKSNKQATAYPPFIVQNKKTLDKIVQHIATQAKGRPNSPVALQDIDNILQTVKFANPQNASADTTPVHLNPMSEAQELVRYADLDTDTSSLVLTYIRTALGNLGIKTVIAPMDISKHPEYVTFKGNTLTIDDHVNPPAQYKRLISGEWKDVATGEIIKGTSATELNAAYNKVTGANPVSDGAPLSLSTDGTVGAIQVPPGKELKLKFNGGEYFKFPDGSWKAMYNGARMNLPRDDAEKLNNLLAKRNPTVLVDQPRASQ